MANGSGGGSVGIKIIPPPPAPIARVISLVLAFLAVILALTNYNVLAGISAGLSFAFNLWDLLANRGRVDIPKSMLDADGKLRVEERQ